MASASWTPAWEPESRACHNVETIPMPCDVNDGSANDTSGSKVTEVTAPIGEEGGTPLQNDAWIKAQAALKKVQSPERPSHATNQDQFTNNLYKLYPWMSTVGNPYAVFARPPVATPSWMPTQSAAVGAGAWGQSSFTNRASVPYNNTHTQHQPMAYSRLTVSTPIRPQQSFVPLPPPKLAIPPTAPIASQNTNDTSNFPSSIRNQMNNYSFRLQNQSNISNISNVRGGGAFKHSRPNGKTGGNMEPLGPGVKMRSFANAKSGVRNSSSNNSSSVKMAFEESEQSTAANNSGTMPETMQKYVSRAYLAAETETQKNKVQTALEMKLKPLLQSGAAWKVDWDKEPLPTDTNFVIGGWVPASQLRKIQQQTNSNSAPQQRNFRARQRWNSNRSGSRSKSKSRSRSRSRSRDHKKRKSNRWSSPSTNDRSDRSSRNESNSPSNGKYKSARSPQFTPKNLTKKQRKAANKAIKQNKQQKKQQPSKRMTLAGDVMQQAKEKINRAKRFASHLNNGNRPKPRVAASRISKNDSYVDNFSWSLDKGSDDELDLSTDFNVVGTCTQVEKPFFRLTAAPDPSQIRTEETLARALVLVKRKWKENGDYHYACDQLRSIRQDFTVQRIRNSHTVDSYEAHARIALEKGDREEFNKCQTQLRILYRENPGCEHEYEFTAYRLLYYLSMDNLMDVNTFLCELDCKSRVDETIKFAMDVRKAWAQDSYAKLFKLYLQAPQMSSYVMDLFVDKERKKCLSIMTKSYRPSLPVDLIMDQLGFGDDLLACIEWLKIQDVKLVEKDTKIDCRVN